MNTPILTVAPADTWNLDAVHSRVDFEVSYLAGTFKGEFHVIGAELTVDGARASLEVAGHDGRLDVSNFPSAGSDRVYQVWLVRGNGRPASAGLFRVAGNGQATFAIPESLKGVDQVLVSVEPGGGSEQPTTKPVVAASTA